MRVQANTFRKLSELWRQEREPDAPDPAALIMAYSKAATRRAAYLHGRWPDIDWEPLCQEALYITAYAWRPGRAGFCYCLAYQILGRSRGPIQTLRRRRARLKRLRLAEVPMARRCTFDPMQPWELE